MNKIIVLGDRVLIEPAQREEKSKNGIIMPESDDKQSKAEGVIVDLGNGEELKKLNLSVGDHVIFEKWGGEEIEISESIEDETGDPTSTKTVKYKIMNHDKILAVIQEVK